MSIVHLHSANGQTALDAGAIRMAELKPDGAIELRWKTVMETGCTQIRTDDAPGVFEAIVKAMGEASNT